MSFDRDALAQAVARHGVVVRVVVAEAKGSTPREVGASMLVWSEGQGGTIGGGALEHEATETARAMLAGGTARSEKMPLGPRLGQCCGGAVVLVYERFDASNDLGEGVVMARAITGAQDMSLAIARALQLARAQGIPPEPQFIDGWMLEPVTQPNRHIWVWGAGHVGRAIVQTLAPLPGIAITWVDTDASRFPGHIPDGVTQLTATDPGLLANHAAIDAEHLILTYSHVLDFDLCHRLLQRGFADLGLIGSATKWARFRKRLAALGHIPADIARITCPIGDPRLGKHPQAIAVGVVCALLSTKRAVIRKERAG